MSNMIQVEPRIFEEEVKEQVWKDAMVEEYESMMKNNVWEVVTRLKGKFVVTYNVCIKLSVAQMEIS